jgi:hypothetical protein
LHDGCISVFHTDACERLSVCSQVDNVGKPSWQAQVTGSKRWVIEPPPECYLECVNRMEVTLNAGDISECSQCIVTLCQAVMVAGRMGCMRTFASLRKPCTFYNSFWPLMCTFCVVLAILHRLDCWPFIADSIPSCCMHSQGFAAKTITDSTLLSN